MVDENYDDSEQTEETWQEEENVGEPVSSRESVIESLFDTKRRVDIIRRHWRGERLISGVWKQIPNRELAGDSFINKQMSAMVSVIDDLNSFTKKPFKECQRILHDAVKAFILDMVNDRTVKRKDYRSLSKQYEHALELFLGLVENGHGAKVLRDSLAGIHTPDSERREKFNVDKWLNGSR